MRKMKRKQTKKKPQQTTRTSRIEQKKKLVISSLGELGEQIYSQLSRRQWPSIRMPSRSINNIRYDTDIRQYILGEHYVKRSSRNIRHVRPLTQLVWTGSFVDELTREGKTSTLRDVFYSAQAYEMNFTDQAESDGIITDLETVLGHAREDFNVFPEERSAIFGDLTIRYTVPGYEGKELNLASHPDGMMIGPALTNSEFAECKADKIIAIEKGGLFTRFIEEKVHEKHKALLIHTAGQAPRATRALIRRMSQELKLPVYIFCDADPWGMHIANVIISGSANAAHLRELNTPDAKWAGVWASITGDEPVIVSSEGLIRNEPISEIVDPLMKPYSDGAVSLDGGTDLRALCCASDGKTGMEEISGVLRHKYSGPIYELVTAGGYRVKATENHSVQTFDLQACELRSKPVSELREGDLLASCFHVPNNESVTSLNLAELLITHGNPRLHNNIFVMSEADDFAFKFRSKHTKNQPGETHATIRRHKGTRLSYFVRENKIPVRGHLRLLHPKQTLPVTIPVTTELARLLGYHTSERGFFKGKRGTCCELTFSLSEKRHVKDAINCIVRSLGLKPRTERRKNTITIRYGGLLLASILSEVFASGKSARSKRIPYLVFNFPDHCKIEFLRGYLRGDGISNYAENTRLAAKTTSRNLASDLVVLFRQLGCVAYSCKQGPNFIVATANTERIQDIVLELCGRYVKDKTGLLSLPSNIVYELRHEIRHHVPYGKRNKIDASLFAKGHEGRIEYARLRKILNSLEHDITEPRLRTISSLIKNQVVLLPLIAKERVDGPSPIDVYDLEVSSSHTFVGGLGGVVLHNSDIVEYKLPSDPLTDLDIKRLYELQKDPRYEGTLWKKEIETFLKVKRKSEQEAFSRYGLSYIVDKYLPKKLKELD